MKQKITFKLCLAMLGLLLSFSAEAQKVIIDQLKYTLRDNGTASVAPANDETISGEIVILASVEYNGKIYSVTTTESGYFASCEKITAITFPNSMTIISGFTFGRCTGLTSITIPNSVTIISYNAFMYCTGLTSITIGNSVTEIGNEAFVGCAGLQEIKVYVEEPITIADNVFTSVDYSTCKLYVPQGSIEKYQAAAVWSKFTNISALPIPTAIGEVDEDELNVYSIDGKVVIKNLRKGEAISICNTTGQNVYQGNETEVPLSKGIYFVKVGTIVSKVMVQ